MSKDFLKRFIVTASKVAESSSTRTMTTSTYLSAIETEEILNKKHNQESKKNNNLTPSSTPRPSTREGGDGHKRG